MTAKSAMAIMVYVPDGSFAVTVLVMVFIISGKVVVVGMGLTLYIVVGVVRIDDVVIWEVDGGVVCCVDVWVEEVT